MNSFLFVTFVICLASAYGFGEVTYKNLLSKNQCSSSLGPRVVGGKKAPKGSFPYQVSLRQSSQHFCGGAIINEQWILTAAHCLEGFTDNDIEVYVGSNILYGDGDLYKSAKVIPHEEFDYDSVQNDIGMIKLSKPIKFKKSVKAIPLPTFDILKHNHPAILSGWGNLKNEGFPPKNLQYLATCLINQENCQNQVPTPINEGNICAFTRYNQGACSGDSGGPLVADGALVGVVSYGLFGCAQGFPDVYTRVHHYSEWINQKLDNF